MLHAVAACKDFIQNSFQPPAPNDKINMTLNQWNNGTNQLSNDAEKKTSLRKLCQKTIF